MDPNLGEFKWDGVYQNEGPDTLRMPPGVSARQDASKGVAHENYGPLPSDRSNHAIEFAKGVFSTHRTGPRIAPGLAGPVVHARARQARHFLLHQAEMKRKTRHAVHDKNGRIAAADAVDMYAAVGHLDQRAGGLWIGREKQARRG